MKQLATDNYDFERLITDGYAYVDAAKIQYNDDDAPGDLFDALIKGLAAANDGDKKVVVLIDEYDHPLGGLLDDRKALRVMRREMHGFYSTLKNNVGVIRFLRAQTEKAEKAVFMV